MSIYEASITNPKKQLEFYKDLSEQLQLENQKLKKQLEEINKMIEKCGFVNIEQVMLSYCGLIAQQKEFVRYLEEEIEFFRTFNLESANVCKDILVYYKKIIGDDK